MQKIKMASELYRRVKAAYDLHEKGGWYSHADLFPLVSKEHLSAPLLKKYFSKRRSCVLACIREEEDGELSVLLTVRSTTVSFKGQVCLPGGMEDESDGGSLIATALREADEEINLKQDQVNVIGLIPPFMVVNTIKSQVFPCYAVMATLAGKRNELQLIPNEDEVSDYFWMPLRSFISSGPHHQQIKSGALFGGDSRLSLDRFSYKSREGKLYQVMGLTARLCIVTAMVAFNEPPHWPLALQVCAPVEREEVHDERKGNLVPILRLPHNKYNLLPMKSKL